MNYDKDKKEIHFERDLNNLDKFVFDFVSLLDSYVLVSGYVPIINGRSRGTEEVDLLVPKMDLRDFEKLWKRLDENGFECLNTPKVEDAFEMLNEHAIRFARKGKAVPNIEFKLVDNGLGKYALENRIKLFLKDKMFWISPLELQIAYKLFLASDGTDEELIQDKDIEDARHLYKLFEDKINNEEFLSFVRKLNKEKRLRFLE